MQIERTVQVLVLARDMTYKVGNQTIWLFEEPLPVFSEFVVGRLDDNLEIFIHSIPTPLLVKCISLCLDPRFG